MFRRKQTGTHSNRRTLIREIHTATGERVGSPVTWAQVVQSTKMPDDQALGCAQWAVHRGLLTWVEDQNKVALTDEGLDWLEHAEAHNASTSYSHVSAWAVAIVGGALAAIIATAVTGAFNGDDGGGSDTSDLAGTTSLAATPDGSAAVDQQCGLVSCVTLFVANTITDGRDLGVYVRSTPYEEGERLTGQFAGSVVFGVCVVADGLDVDGSSLWIKSPFEFVRGDLDANDGFVDPQSRSVTDASEFGWINAAYLKPASAVTELPACA